MEKQVRVGVGVMILHRGKVLLGHRPAGRQDTGGIQQPDCWALPGGKQEFGETFFDCAAREVREETGIAVENLELFSAADDIARDRHFLTLWVVAHSHRGEARVMERAKEDSWRWFDLKALPENLYSPSEKFLRRYIRRKGIL